MTDEERAKHYFAEYYSEYHDGSNIVCLADEFATIRRETIEECAKVCEEDREDDRWDDMTRAGPICASRIRALGEVGR